MIPSVKEVAEKAVELAHAKRGWTIIALHSSPAGIARVGGARAGKRVAICATECAAAIGEAATSEGPEPWEAKSSSRTRTSHDRSVYIRGYSGCKEVSFYPFPRSPPTDQRVYHRFRIYPSIPPSPRSARFDDMLSNRQPRQTRTDREPSRPSFHKMAKIIFDRCYLKRE